MRIKWTLIAVAVTTTGCAAYDPNLPATPFFCGSTDPKCPDGYTCMPSTTGDPVCTNAMIGSSVDAPPSGSCATPFSGTLATWTFTSEPGSQTATAPASSAPGVTAGSITRASGLMPSAGTGSISASGWPTSSQPDTTLYFTLAIGGPAGCKLDVTSMVIDAKSSNTGPTLASIATSQDSFVQTVAITPTAPATATLSVSDAGANLEIRIYGYSATASTGTMRVQNQLTVTGALR